MTEPMGRISIFDKSHKEPGKYCLYTKSGGIVKFTSRSEIWKDKTNCYFVTLKPAWVKAPVDNYTCHEELDIRYNEISAVGEDA